ncbi:MAG: hypothetical protein ACO210_05120 [Sediminibacterium sp.]
MNKVGFIISMTAFCATQLNAQSVSKNGADTAKVVTITSAFKPSLRPLSKVNFLAATPFVDNSKVTMQYVIPSQNISFGYQAVAVTPLAYVPDSVKLPKRNHFIKVGLGNLNTIVAEAGFNIGDGIKNNTYIGGGYKKMKGPLFAQEFTDVNFSINSAHQIGEAHDLSVKFTTGSTTRYAYGFKPASIPYTKDNILNKYNSAGITVHLANKTDAFFGIHYTPTISFEYLQSGVDEREFETSIAAPVSKNLGTDFKISVQPTASFSTTVLPTIPNNLTIVNNLFSMPSTFSWITSKFQVHLGAAPTVNNGTYAVLPQVSGVAILPNNGLRIELGWAGHFEKNNLRSLSAFNPWVRIPNDFANTKISEQFLGVKLPLGDHFTYGARLSLLEYENQALFTNAFTDGRLFKVMFEPTMRAVQLQANVSYTLQDKLNVLGGVTYKKFSGLKVQNEAWGLLPLELNGSLHWKFSNKLSFTSTFYAWDGAQSMDAQMATKKLPAAADFSLGATLKVVKSAKFWVQLNNLFDNRYQRWNQYEVFGRNVVAGFVYSFSGK